jgi:Leucine-rich repeat (LRR) protein
MVLAIRSFGSKETIVNFAKLIAMKTSNPDYPVVGFILFLPNLNSPVIAGNDIATIATKVSAIQNTTADDATNARLQEFDTLLSTFTFIETLGWKTYTNTQYKFSVSYPSTWKVEHESLQPNKDEGVSPYPPFDILYQPDENGALGSSPFMRIGFWPNPSQKTLGQLFDEYYAVCVGSQGGDEQTCQNAADAPGLVASTKGGHDFFSAGAEPQAPNDSVTNELYAKVTDGYVVLSGFPEGAENVQQTFDEIFSSISFRQ